MTEIIFVQQMFKAATHFSGILSLKDGAAFYFENQFQELICAFILL